MVPVTAIRFLGFFLINLKEISANNFLGFLTLKKIIFLLLILKFFLEIIILAPLLIASKIYLFPSNFVPSIAKKNIIFFYFFAVKSYARKISFVIFSIDVFDEVSKIHF